MLYSHMRINIKTILDTYKKKIIESPIVHKILDLTAKANIDRLDFGLKKNNQ